MLEETVKELAIEKDRRGKTKEDLERLLYLESDPESLAERI